MLAYQNLQANDAFKPLQEDQAVEIHALEGSLTVMQQVLNDVLGMRIIRFWLAMRLNTFTSRPSAYGCWAF